MLRLAAGFKEKLSVETNPISNQLDDLRQRSEALRGYL
jgi:hypothetical protein